MGELESADPVAGEATLFLVLTGALLLLLIAGTAAFYGGIGRRGRPVRALVVALVGAAVVVLVWVGYGYGAAFGPPLIPHWLGEPLSHPGLLGLSAYQGAYAGFQCLVAVFAVTLIGASQRGRVRLGPWAAFVVLWTSLVYLPVAYAVFNDVDGWAATVAQVLDFAGGIVVQVNAGAAALAVALALRMRSGRRDAAADPGGAGRRGRTDAPATYALLGAFAMWVGWFALDAGSETVADGVAALAWINTLVAPGAGLITWIVVRVIQGRRPTLVGAAFGAIAGMAAISPACNCIAPGWAIVLGVVAAVPCALVLEWEFARRLCGRALPVVGIHVIGGLIGTLYIGLFGSGVGLVDAGNFNQLVIQAAVAAGVMLFSFSVTWAIAFALERTVGLRPRDEGSGSIETPAARASV